MSGSRKSDFEVIWRIRNIKAWFQSRDETLYSPQFLAETLVNTRWKLCLSSNLHLGERYVGLTLQRDVDNGPEVIALKYELSILDDDQSPLNIKSCAKKFDSKTISHELNVKEIEIFEDKKENYLPDDVMTVGCKTWKAWPTDSKSRGCLIDTAIGLKTVVMNSAIDNCNSFSENSRLVVKFMSASSEIGFISFYANLNEHNRVEFKLKEMKCNCVSMFQCRLYVLKQGGYDDAYECDRETLFDSYKPLQITTWFDGIDFENYAENNSLKLRLDLTCYPVVISESIDYDKYNTMIVADEAEGKENLNTLFGENAHYIRESLTEYKDKPCDIEKKECEDDECFKPSYFPTTTLKNDLTLLYNDRLFCDTKLKTDTETFPAHRCVLSARSPVFKKMFNTEMKEKISDCISISDISSDTIRRMLQFIYTDCTRAIDMQSAKDLYIASDKYDIASLKERCVSFMKDNLCPSNVCEVLVLADMHQDKELQNAAQEFVLTYDKEVFGSEEWKLFMKNFSGIAAQVMYLKCFKE